MSIYRSRDTRPTYNDVTERVTRGRTLMPATISAEDWASVRRAQPADYLLPKSVQWFVSLPRAVRPLALVNKYPRIANMLALDWNRSTCRGYFVDLLTDRRGHRQGFPADVDRDLRLLCDYYHSLHPTLDD
jgi:hypothetical protein